MRLCPLVEQDGLAPGSALTMSHTASLELWSEGEKGGQGVSLSGQDGQRELPLGEHLLCVIHFPLLIQQPSSGG